MRMINTDWHAQEGQVVASLFDVDPKAGLTTSQVAERQLRYGHNLLQKIKSRPAWRVLVDQFASIVIALLAVAAAIAWAVGDNAEALAILIVLIINAVVGFATEWKAGRALDALRRQSHTTARVRRDRFERTIDAEELPLDEPRDGRLPCYGAGG
jgi:P-type Ca2+ transporter type 2C